MIPPGEQLLHDRFRKQVGRSRRVVDNLDGLSRVPGAFGAGWGTKGGVIPRVPPPSNDAESGRRPSNLLDLGHCDCHADGDAKAWLETTGVEGQPPPTAGAPGAPCGDQQVYSDAGSGRRYDSSAGECIGTATCEDRSEAERCCSDWLGHDEWGHVDNLCQYLNIDGETGWGAEGSRFLASVYDGGGSGCWLQANCANRTTSPPETKTTWQRYGPRYSGTCNPSDFEFPPVEVEFPAPDCGVLPESTTLPGDDEPEDTEEGFWDVLIGVAVGGGARPGASGPTVARPPAGGPWPWVPVAAATAALAYDWYSSHDEEAPSEEAASNCKSICEVYFDRCIEAGGQRRWPQPLECLKCLGRCIGSEGCHWPWSEPTCNYLT